MLASHQNVYENIAGIFHRPDCKNKITGQAIIQFPANIHLPQFLIDLSNDPIGGNERFCLVTARVRGRY
jgi:hypothetical protein